MLPRFTISISYGLKDVSTSAIPILSTRFLQHIMLLSKILCLFLSFGVNDNVVQHNCNGNPLAGKEMLSVAIYENPETTETLPPALQGTHAMLRSNSKMCDS